MAVNSFPSNVLVAYPEKGKDSAFAVSGANQLYVYNARAANNTGGAINVGICNKFGNGGFAIYSSVGTAYTNITASLVAGTAKPVFSGAANAGFLVQSISRSNLIGLTISTAAAGGTFAYQYWNGTTFVTLTTLEVPTDYSATGDVYTVFRAPLDWVTGAPTGTGDVLHTDWFSIRVISTGAPGGAISANNVWVGGFLEFYNNVPDAAVVQLSFPDTKPLVLKGGEGLFPYFSTTNAANQFGTFYSVV